MNMKQDKRDPLTSHCRRPDGVCLVLKRTCVFVNVLGATEPYKIIEGTRGSNLFVEPRTSVHGVRPE